MKNLLKWRMRQAQESLSNVVTDVLRIRWEIDTHSVASERAALHLRGKARKLAHAAQSLWWLPDECLESEI